MHLFLILIIQIISFQVCAGYLFEYDDSRVEYIRSINNGNEGEIEFCEIRKGGYATYNFDCDFSGNDIEKYFSSLESAFSFFVKSTSESRLSKIYSLGRGGFCFFIVPENKGYDKKEKITDCKSFYVPVPIYHDKYEKHAIATLFASVAHENFHINFNPFEEKGSLGSLFLNEYAASLIMLNSYSVLNRYLGIDFDGRWKFDLAEKFQASSDLDEYCSNYDSLKLKNIEIGNDFESVMGTILASIFASKSERPNLLPIYIYKEISFLIKNDVSEEQLLHRLGLCGGEPGYSILQLELVDFDIDCLVGDDGNLNILECGSCFDNDFLCELIKSSKRKYSFFMNAGGVTENSAKTHPEINKGNIFYLNSNMRFVTKDGIYVIDSGAESNVWPEGEMDCDENVEVKTVRNLFNEKIELVKCGYFPEVGTIWTKKGQSDKVLSLRELTKYNSEFHFVHDRGFGLNEIKLSEEKEVFPYIYLNGLITFQSKVDQVNYCLDTGSQFSLFTFRAQEVNSLYPFTNDGYSVHQVKVLNKSHILISFQNFEPSAKFKSQPVMAPEQCDIVVGADLLGRYRAFSLTRDTLTFYRN